ncbi:hypothetical protein [Acidovorax carolinensis]|uniref:hypothetical protein n=1 Tax=Acidovorax carolinensis TaxID=553814 RepID=UPI0012FF637F|nr:hypothetical protein [Acidovorax carolinensis]
MIRINELPDTGENGQVRSSTEQREAVVTLPAAIDQALVDSLAEFDDLYRQLAH